MTFHLAPRCMLGRSMLILVVLGAGLIASGPASAAKGRPVGGTCSGGGQLCNNIATFTINVGGPGGVGEGNFTPGPLTCSNLRIHFIVDGTEVAVTGFDSPDASRAQGLSLPSSASVLSAPENMWSVCRRKDRSQAATSATSCHGLAG